MRTKEVARILLDNVDAIIRRWVDELRRSDRTQVHNQLLSAEIVDGMKVVLANLAEAIAAHETPEADISMTPRPPVDQPPARNRRLTDSQRPKTTRPLIGPLARAVQAASYHGRLRQDQRYELHEVVLEHVKLRQIIWDTVRSEAESLGQSVGLDTVLYVDRLLDELMLTAVESFYSSSIRDLEKRAIRDPLTELYNKDYFQQRLNAELRRAARYGDALALVIIDVDLLKQVNDTYGHQVGDSVIASIASAIHERSRQSDVPCRYGGDEFAVILPETTKTQARVFAERVANAIRDLNIVIAPGDKPSSAQEQSVDEARAGDKMPLVIPIPSISIGIAAFPQDARNPETLVARADAALYRAKKQGRNRISF